MSFLNVNYEDIFIIVFKKLFQYMDEKSDNIITKHGKPEYLLPIYGFSDHCCMCDCMCPYSKYKDELKADWEDNPVCVKKCCCCLEPCFEIPCCFLTFCYQQQACECLCPPCCICPCCYFACCQTCPRCLASFDCIVNCPFNTCILCFECFDCACCYKVKKKIISKWRS